MEGASIEEWLEWKISNRLICHGVSVEEFSMRNKEIAIGIALGIAIGASVGSMLGDIGIGVGVGLAMGLALGSLWKHLRQKP